MLATQAFTIFDPSELRDFDIPDYVNNSVPSPFNRFCAKLVSKRHYPPPQNVLEDFAKYCKAIPYHMDLNAIPGIEDYIDGVMKAIEICTYIKHITIPCSGHPKFWNIVASFLKKNKTVEWILSCQNMDGGFGCVPGCESHAGQILTALCTLSIANALDRIDKDVVGFWLSERQDSESGGFYSRPEKLPDVCYTWWVGASISIIDRKDWIDADKLEEFVLSAQDDEYGGIADRPPNHADPFHTFFGCAGLSLFNRLDLPEMDPVFALPKELLKKKRNKITIYRAESKMHKNSCRKKVNLLIAELCIQDIYYSHTRCNTR